MKAPIQSEKHYVQYSPFSLALGAVTTKHIANSVAVDAKNDSDEVIEGSIVKAVYLELWIIGDDTPVSSFIFTIEKQVGGIANMAVGEIAALHDYPNKKNVLYTSMGLTPGNTNFPQAIFKGWVRIPKGKQRMGLGDVIVFNINAALDGLLLCGFTTYKSYS